MDVEDNKLVFLSNYCKFLFDYHTLLFLIIFKISDIRMSGKYQLYVLNDMTYSGNIDNQLYVLNDMTYSGNIDNLPNLSKNM